MSSGGGRTQTQTQTNEPPAWAVPYYQQGLNLAGRVANQPFQQYTGQMSAGQTADQRNAAQMTRQLAGNNALLDRGSSFAQGILGGQGQFNARANPYQGQTGGTNPYAGQNPYLNDMIAQSSQDVTDAYNRSAVPSMMSQFQSGGAFGGTAMMDAMQQSDQTLAKELGNLSNQYRFQDYTTQQQLAENALNREQNDLSRNAGLAESHLGRQQGAWDSFQGRQMGALGMIPGLDQQRYFGANQLAQQGAQQQLTNQAGIDARYNEFLRGQGWDQQQLSSLAQMLGTIQGGGSTTSGANPNYRSAGQNALSLAAMVGGAALMASSKDLKTKHGELDPDDALAAVRSLPMDRWSYHGETEPHVGTYAENFHANLGLPSKPYINNIDMFGALGGAIQALDKKISKKVTK